MKTKKFIYVFFIIIAFLQACKIKNKEVYTIDKKQITEALYASGYILSENQYQIQPTVSGEISSILIDEGDFINIGDTLFKIKNDAQSINKDNAELSAEFNAISNNQNKIQEVKIAIERARDKYSYDSLMYNRQVILHQKNIISESEFESAELNFKNSKNNFKSAKLKFDNTLKQLNYNAKQSLNQLKSTSINSNEYFITSKVKGLIYSILKNKGELVSQQTILAVLGDDQDFKIELQIDEVDIIKVKPKQKVLIELDSYKGEVFEGQITKINPIMNERTKSFTIEATFKTPPPKLYPNLTLEANIIVNTKQNTMVIPREYLTNNDEVFLEDGTKIKVTTGLKDYEKIEILSGLSVGQKIILPINE